MTYRSRCPAGQHVAVSRNGKRFPVHTAKLGAACCCGACRSQRIWTPERRAGRSAEYRAKVAAGVQFGSRRPKAIASRWQPEQDQALAGLLGTMDTAGIAAELTRRFGYPRTETAVRERIKRRKLSRLSVRPWSQREVAWVLNVGYERIRAWVRRGWLTGTPWRLGGGQRKAAISQTFTVADVERFLRAHPTLAQPQTIRHAGLKTLALALSRRQVAS
jgi:hypothetical protein